MAIRSLTIKSLANRGLLLSGAVIAILAMSLHSPVQITVVTQASQRNYSGSLLFAGNHNRTSSTSDTAITGSTLPRSLQGTQVDGRLAVDAGGHLIINGDVRSLFDYFLAAQGEEPLERIESRIRAYIQNHLQAPAADEAQALLTDYLALLQALAALDAPAEQPSLNSTDIAQQLQQISALRHAWLTPQVAAAFYGEDEEYDQFSLQSLVIMGDGQLNQQQQLARIQQLQNELPGELNAALQQSQQILTLDRANQQLQQEDASAQELYSMRQQLVGDAAADRLAELDQQRQVWQQRLQSWLQLRSATLQDPRLSDGDKEEQLTQLRNQHFLLTERNRVQALEQISDTQ